MTAAKKKPAQKKVTPKRPRGRQTIRTPEIVEKILDGLMAGTPMTVICREEGFPEPRTVRAWEKDDKEFAAAIARAREQGEDFLAWECKQIADTPQIGTKSVSKATGLEITEGDMIEHRKLQIYTRLQLLAKFNPKRWGDKQQIEHSGSIGIAERMRMNREKRATRDT